MPLTSTSKTDCIPTTCSISQVMGRSLPTIPRSSYYLTWCAPVARVSRCRCNRFAACSIVTVRSCRYFGPEVAAARRSVRPVPDRACGSASVRANRVAMRFQCPTPFPTLAITPLRSASIVIWQTLRTAPYRHDRTVTFNQQTDEGREMTACHDLLPSAIRSMIDIKEEKDLN